MPSALQLRYVRLSLGGNLVLDGVSLQVEPGSLVALLGPNGAGKTSLIRCSTGLIRPDAGSVQIFDANVDAAVRTGTTSVMPQRVGAWSGIKPIELLHHLAGLYARPLPVAEVAARLGIDRFAATPYRRLSGGQQQVVNLAATIIGRPRLIFLDEPTAGLDPHARNSVWDLIDELRAAGVSILLTTHAMDEADRLADRIVIIDTGRIRLTGSPTELTADGRSLEQVFLASTANRIRP